MSIESEANRIKGNVASTYSAAAAYGASIPETQNSENLPQTVESIKAVLHIEQTLTDAQKAQARENIGAVPAEIYVGDGEMPDDAVVQFILYGEDEEKAFIKIKQPDGSIVEVQIGKGTDGYTPEKGVDYWTEADKAEIKSYVDEAILGGAW